MITSQPAAKPNADDTATKRALAFLDAHDDDLILLTQELIAAPTENPPGNERAAAEIFTRWLERFGFHNTTIHERFAGRSNLLSTWSSGRPGKRLILNGHLDTKPVSNRDQWQSDPHRGEIRDGNLYGLGSVDMKGADAALLFGMAAAVQAGGDALCGDLLLALTADEEGQAQEGPRYLLEECGVTGDAVLIAEPSGILAPWDSIPLISRGFCGLRFTVHGTQTHSSICDRVSVVNATLAAARLLLHLQDNLRIRHPQSDLCPQGPTVNLGASIQGGVAPAIVSGKVEFTADIRTLPGMSQQRVAEDIETALATFRALHPNVPVEWSFVEGNLAWTKPTAVEPVCDLVRSLQESSRQVLGAAPPLGYFPGGTDAIWWQGMAGIPTVPGFGPGLLSSAHRPNEYVDLVSLKQAARIYALTILHYLATPQTPNTP